jgi:putative flavoprotein involved in K+ transport
MATHVLTVKTPIGRVVRQRFHVERGRSRGLPLGRVRRKDLTAAGIQRVPKTTGGRGGRPLLDDGRILEVANVICCTGFVPDFGWIDLPAFAVDGGPVHDRGIVGSEPGLYFVGLVFSYALASSLVSGVGRDAAHIAKHIASRQPNSRPTEHVVAGARQQGPAGAGVLSGLLRLVMAWRRRRGPHMADPLVSPDPERASARATLAYCNQVGDPSL